MDKSWKQFSSEEKKFYLENNAPDCAFLVFMEGEEEPMELKSFKFILSSVSPVFERMFNGDFEEAKSSDPIKITDIYACDFNVFLSFVYDENPYVNNWTRVYNVAKKYLADDIVELIFNKINNVSRTPKENLQLFEINWNQWGSNVWKPLSTLYTANSVETFETKCLYTLHLSRNSLQGAFENQCLYILHLSPEVFLELLKFLKIDVEKIGKYFHTLIYYCSFSKHISTLEKQDFIKICLQRFNYKDVSTRDFFDYVECCDLFDIPTKYNILIDILRKSIK